MIVPEHIEAAMAATVGHSIKIFSHSWTCSCGRGGADINPRGESYRHLVELEIEAAERVRIADPGSQRWEYGREDGKNGLISRVSDTEFGRRHATHTRRVVVWVGEGPNDNWPRFIGPWSPITERELEPEVEACVNGFHWVGQPWSSCDQCSLPAWEHAGLAVLSEKAGIFDLGSEPLVLRPWKPGEAEKIRDKWGR